MDTKEYKIEMLFGFLLAETAEETCWNRQSQDRSFAVPLTETICNP